MYTNLFLVVGVGYTGKIFRIWHCIFFSLTFGIVITNPKKFFKNIEKKKIREHLCIRGLRGHEKLLFRVIFLLFRSYLWIALTVLSDFFRKGGIYV